MHFWEVSGNMEVELEATIRLWNGQTKKKFYNYLLIKSKEYNIFKESMLKQAGPITELNKITEFLEACLYVGKGQGDRPIQGGG